jgi:hypothetical protein
MLISFWAVLTKPLINLRWERDDSLSIYIGLAGSEIWKVINGVKDPELIRLARSLPETVLKARADSTTRKYLGSFGRWCTWANTKDEIAVFPICTAHFALYLQHVGESTKSRAAVEEAVNAVSWVQRLAGMEPVSHDVLIRTVADGFQRILAKPKIKKEPVTPQMLQELIGSMSVPPSLSEIRLATICLLAFAAFLRYNEIAGLRCNDVKIGADKMVVNIRSSKTDQFRQGASVPIACSTLVTCPVAMMERYIAVGVIDVLSDKHLFRAIVKLKQGERLRATGSLSYTRMRELVLGKIRSLTPEFLCCIVFELEVLQQQQTILLYQNVTSNVMADGSQSLLRMVILRIQKVVD